MRCYEYVSEVLNSEEARKLVTRIVAKMVILYSRWFRVRSGML